jgi:hypothetical protein
MTPCIAESLERARLPHQLADFGQYPGQHRAFFLSSLGEKMVFFDGTQNRFHLFQSRVEPLNAPFLQLHQGATTALRQASQNARFVGIANRQFLRRGVRRHHPLVDKAKAMRLLNHQGRHLLDTGFAQGRISPSNIGMVANLGLARLLTPNKDARHHILGQMGFHLARIEALDQHQHHQRHI